MKIIFSLIMGIMMISLASAYTNVSTCKTLNVENEVYQLNKSFSTTGSLACFGVTQNNVTLNMMGYTITGDGEVASNGGMEYALYSNNWNGTTFINGTIVNFPQAVRLYGNNAIVNNIKAVNISSAYSYSDDDGTYTFDSCQIEVVGNNNSITNNEVKNIQNIANGKDSWGICLSDKEYVIGLYSQNSTLNNNNITNISGTYLVSGIIFAGQNNVLNNNNISLIKSLYTTTSGKSYGIYGFNLFAALDGKNKNNSVTNSQVRNITGTPDFSAYGVYLDSANNTYINNLTIENILGAYDFSQGLSLYLSPDSQVKNINIINVITIASGTKRDIYTDSKNITCLNCSYTLSKESVVGGNLTRQWYYNAITNLSDGTNLNLQNVTIINSTILMNVTSNSLGVTNIANLTEYVNNGGTRVYRTNYTFNSTYSGTTISHTYNLTKTNNIFNDVFTWTVSSNCWTKTGTGRGSVLFIPRGCLYQLNRGIVG